MANDLLTQVRAKLVFDVKAYEQEAKRYSFEQGAETKDQEHLEDEQVHAALKHLVLFEHARTAPIVEALTECSAALEWLAGRHAAFLKANPEFSRAEYFADDRHRDLPFEREMAAYEALRKLAEVSK